MIGLLGSGVGSGALLMTTAAAGQQPGARPSALVFDSVTVVDVEQGRLAAGQRVVIVGNRIRAVGPLDSVRIPAKARVVAAAGKYLIPGLWDMDVHSRRMAHWFYPLLLANGVTGMRDAGSELPLRTQRGRHRAILAGTRVGPPRQVLGGPLLTDGWPCRRWGAACATDTARARALVDSLAAAAADMITLSGYPAMQAVVLAHARRVGLPVEEEWTGAGLATRTRWTATDLADSGVRLLTHTNSTKDLDAHCVRPSGEFAACRQLADRFRHNGTWWVPALLLELYRPSVQVAPQRPPDAATAAILGRFDTVMSRWRSGMIPRGNWLQNVGRSAEADSVRLLARVREVELPIVAGTDTDIGPSEHLWRLSPGFVLHGELALEVAAGLTPLGALQSATLNPAKLLRATDSLGTVAPGKLADLVLLDANPLADITNTTTIRAVVANGRYFDRAALDQLLTDVRRAVRDEP